MASPKFDARWQRKQRWASRWRALRWWLLLGVLLAGGWWLTRSMTPAANPVDLPRSFTICAERGSAACVIDGDTVSIGTPTQRRRIRFTGYDAPELDGACQAERAAARRARSALHGWLNAAPAQMDGGEDPPRDQYGRELRRALRAPGTPDADLAETMLAAKLASESGWGADPIEWCKQR